ncbi:protein kinase domain-containing protein [Butyrivibrio sp.]|uniref:protein kinase domain-containing protein n=1 Tax=Butyrivibrio sp. TaxID=28121 RepID=UPI0025BC3E14|nr:protein kinase [Butyrivibrio sp.]MBE5837971.1 hypothetical protein [Butyrivibrio sp.]
MGNETSINSSVIDNRTSINRLADNNGTQINSAIENANVIASGVMLCGEYCVKSKLDTQTGEADLFLCEKDGEHYVAKVYRRKVAVKAEIINKLIKMDSPYVSRVFATGDFNGYPVEILPYYKYGSLQNKKFSYMELKKHIIPSLNEGLNVLHSAGIIHKDLKPSNIMLNDNQIDVAIIDFGISSVRDASNTVVVTSTGMTPEYSAPETFRSLFLNESDYYSLGITIYELFCGRTPYRGMTAEEIEKYVAIQNIPYPEEMPDDLKNLISALTYNDITNRKNKSNPNRRWGYDEVKKWCGGEKLTIPGEGIGNVKGSMPPYTFMGTAYTDKKALAKALGTNWNEGKKQLFRGILSGFFKAVDPEMAGICMDAEEAVDKGKDDDVEFFKVIYAMDSSLEEFIWKGKSFASLEDFGKGILNSLWMKQNLDSFLSDVLSYKVMSLYCDSVNASENIKVNVKKLEDTFADSNKSLRDRTRLYYLVAYMLSGTRIFHYKNEDFKGIEEITAYMGALVRESYEEFRVMCYDLMNGDGELDVQFESWLISMGKNQEIRQWKASLS